MATLAARPALYLQAPIWKTFMHPEVEETTTRYAGHTHPYRPTRIDKVTYVNHTTIALDATNYYTVALKNGSTTIASASLAGGLTAGTSITLTLSSTDADLVAAAGSRLDMVLTKTLSAVALDEGVFTVHGELV